MPPRAQQRPPQSLTPQPGAQGQSGSPIAQLNPQQLAALQEHIRQTRQQTGQEVTPQMITEWMVRNGIAPGAPQQQQQQQQQQQMGMQGVQQGAVPPTQQQVQGNLDAVLHHLYPPALASNPQAAMQHLQNVLFPPNQGHKQSPFLQQVMLLAQNGRLSPEQMAQLKAAVGARNGAQGHPPAQQAQPNVQYQQQQQHQMQAAQVAQQQQQQHAQAAPPNEQTATQAVQQLSQRVHHIEALLGRPDVNDEQRGKMQQELDAARAKLSQVVKMLLAAQAQNGQAAAQAAAAAGGSGGAGGAQAQVNLASLQEAQRQAMERKARELQAAQQAAQQAQQFGTGSPAPYPGGLAAPPGSAALRQSPSVGAGGNVGSPAAGSPPESTGKKAGGKKLTKKQQTEAAAAAAVALQQQQQQQVHNLSQQQAAQQQQAQAQALAHAQAMAQAQAVANQQQAGTAGAAAGGAGGGAPAQGAFMQSQMAIPSALNLPAPTPESFPPARPTISGGLANSPAVATPAIIKHPGLGSSVLGGAGGDAFTAGMGAGKAEGIPNKELRADDSKGRTVNKRKIRELVEAVDPEERLSDEVEDLLLEICDEFIDSITRFGCQLAKHRKSDRLEVKDLALHLERSYNIRVPGFAPEETRQSGARRVNLPPGHAARLAAVRDGGRRR
ncbi:hypothetical protein JCM5296_006271 [Sporobolomyces johnsonii]